MAKCRFERPMRPTPINATLILSLAAMAGRASSEPVTTAAAVDCFRKSRRWLAVCGIETCTSVEYSYDVHYFTGPHQCQTDLLIYPVNPRSCAKVAKIDF